MSPILRLIRNHCGKLLFGGVIAGRSHDQVVGESSPEFRGHLLDFLKRHLTPLMQ